MRYKLNRKIEKMPKRKVVTRGKSNRPKRKKQGEEVSNLIVSGKSQKKRKENPRKRRRMETKM